MTYTRMVEIGRVVYIAHGKEEGKLCTIVEIIDGNRVLVDGPCSGVKRRTENLNNVQLTKFVVSLRHGARTKSVKRAWETAKIDGQWKATNWAKKLTARKLRSSMTDFDRFRLMKAKQMRNRIVRIEEKKLKKEKK